MTRKILILGATSAIARATADAFAAQGDELILAGRDQVELERIAADLSVRFNNQNHTVIFDIEEDEYFSSFYNNVLKISSTLDGLVFAIGYMNKDVTKTLKINFTNPIALLNLFADYFAEQKKGFIIGITSVAGDRGRQSNYHYGAAKGGLSLYLQGLRNRLTKDKIRVITIKPGFVDTAMTFGLPGLFLVAQPQVIGKAIADSVNKNADIVYLPWFWRYIMLIIIHIPEVIFKRMSL